MTRELSIEERMNLMTVALGVQHRYTYEKISHHKRDATVAELHDYLDHRFIPRYTDCPYPLSILEEHLTEGKRLDGARVSEDGALKMSSDEMQRRMFVYALDGKLRRSEPKGDLYRMLYTLQEEASGKAVECEKGDFFIYIPQDKKIHAFTVCPKARAKANAQSEGAV
uniref:Uncharacterized protein n=1 Tax=Pseudomonas phage RVTF4 TaxID=3236931 RepID=A0AB39CCJ1_9VIRU